MNLKELVANAFYLSLLGIILGLIIRILREGISVKHIIQALYLSTFYAFIYPLIILPFDVTNDILIIKTKSSTFKIWRSCLKNININWDDYVDESMLFIKNVTKNKRSDCFYNKVIANKI